MTVSVLCAWFGVSEPPHLVCRPASVLLWPASQILPWGTPSKLPKSRVAQIWESFIMASARTSYDSFQEIRQPLRHLAVSFVRISRKDTRVAAEESGPRNFINQLGPALEFQDSILAWAGNRGGPPSCSGRIPHSYKNVLRGAAVTCTGKNISPCFWAEAVIDSNRPNSQLRGQFSPLLIILRLHSLINGLAFSARR